MNNVTGQSVEFNVHSSQSPKGFFSVESLSRGLEEAEAMWKECGKPITVVIDLVVIRYGRIQSQRSVYLFQRNRPWPG